MNERTYSLDSLVRSIQDVFRLREDIFQNAYDHSLKVREQSPVRFNYIVDTQIVHLYATPRIWAAGLSALPSLKGIDVEDHEGDKNSPETDTGLNAASSSDTSDALEANAFLTGEYIFSNDLVGDGRSLLIAPEHVPEVMDYFAWLEDRADFASYSAVGSDPYAPLRHRLAGLERLVSIDGFSISSVLERLRSALVNGLADLSHTDALAPHRLNRLFDRGLLRNAAGQSVFTKDVISPPAAVIRWWMQAIREARSSSKRPQKQRALEADAVTLAQLAALNSDWKESYNVFVLITDDMALVAAYSRWMRRERAEGRHHFFPLRSSRQFIPILNINEMGGAFRQGDFFAEITRAISTLIETFHSNDVWERWGGDTRFRTPPRAAIADVLRTQFDAYGDGVDARIGDFRERFDEITRIWMDALEYAVTVKSDTIRGLVTEELSYWRRLLAGPELREAFRVEVRNLARGFESLAAASILLRQEIRALEVSKEQGISEVVDLHGRRDLPSEFCAFSSEAFAGKRIVEIVQNIAKLGSEAVSTLADAYRDERLLVMGALCLDIGAWSAAENLLQQAEIALEEQREQRDCNLADEVFYFRCVARRLAADAATWSAQLRPIERTLQRLSGTSDDRSLKAARAIGERFALHLCAVAWSYGNQAEADRHLSAAYAQWRSFTRRFARSPLLEAEPPFAWLCVRYQFELNTMVLAFWWHVLGREMDPGLRSTAAKTLEKYPASDQDYMVGGQHRSIYPMLSRYVLNEDGRDDAARDIVDTIDSIMSLDRQEGFAFDIPNVDREEYMNIKYILRNLHSDLSMSNATMHLE